MKKCEYYIDGDNYDYRRREHKKATTKCGEKASKTILGINYCLKHYNRLIKHFADENPMNKKL